MKKFIEFYLNEVNELQFDSEPNYSKIQTKLNEALKTLGHSNLLVENFQIFNPAKQPTKPSAVRDILS